MENKTRIKSMLYTKNTLYVLIVLSSIFIAYFSMAAAAEPVLTGKVAVVEKGIIKHKYKVNRAIYKIYLDGNNEKTFYTNCAFSDKQIDHASCGYKARYSKTRAKRTEIDHVFPATALLKYTVYGKQCMKNWETSKRSMSPRNYCLKNSIMYRNAMHDMINLVPSVGEINRDKSDHPFGIVYGYMKDDGKMTYGWKRAYGKPFFEVGYNPVLESVVVMPNIKVRGNIARIYRYMNYAHDLQLPTKLLSTMKKWYRTYDMTGWEKARWKAIFKIQGVPLSFKERYAQPEASEVTVPVAECDNNPPCIDPEATVDPAGTVVAPAGTVLPDGTKVPAGTILPPGTKLYSINYKYKLKGHLKTKVKVKSKTTTYFLPKKSVD